MICHFQRRGRKAGIALVMVLACLVIISVLTVAFLQAVRTDLAASTGYASGATSRMLADSALNLVIGQLQDATQRQDEAWVSQPGLIRTYDTSGNAVKTYKLYSSDQLIVNEAFDPLTAGKPTDVPDSWRTDGASVWADLNDPILKAGVPHYPILSPAAIGQVEGFDAPTENLTDKSGNVVKDKNGLAYQAIPMPVKWLYVLKDGTRATVAPGNNGAVKVTSTDSSRPVSASNPPVARMAFWTDDESSKVNINTASEGTPGDLPVASTNPKSFEQNNNLPPTNYVPAWAALDNSTPAKIFEADLAWFQPAAREYQRYPGHPATTCLSTVLASSIIQALGGSPTRSQVLEEIYKFTPRYTGGTGSSFSGTVRPPRSNTSKFQAGSRRLYASTDELLFQPTLDGSQQRDENPLGTDDTLRRQTLDRLGFFLSSDSKSPEQTLFNLPRIAIWPINQAAAKRTPYDKLFAFCSTLKDNSGANHPYYFIRKNPQSPTEDWALTADDGTLRNQTLYKYLQGITSRATPGFTTTTFEQKYSAGERDQILTEIFDYVRTTNLMDNSQNDPSFYYTVGDTQNMGLVLPIEPGNGTRGFGRYFTISELALVSTAVKKNPDTTYNLQVAIVPEFFCVSPGHPNIANRFRMEFEGLSSFKINGSPVFANLGDAFTVNIPKQLSTDSETAGYLGGPMGYRSFVKIPQSGPPPADQIFPIGILDNVASGTQNISGNVKISLYFDPPAGGSPVLVQQGSFEFPSVPFLVPTTTTTDDSDVGYYGKDGRLFPSPFFKSGDWCRSLTPKSAIASDYRLVTAVSSAQDLGSFFDKHPWWNEPDRLIHTLRPPRRDWGGTPSNVKFGMLSAGLPVASMNEQPDIIAPAKGQTDNGVVNSAGWMGDWENSVGIVPDGPSMGHADEGEDVKFGQSGTLDRIPYIGNGYEANGQWMTAQAYPTYFSPNRLIPSPVTFGSLSTGVKRQLPWQTLLFRPDRPYFPGGSPVESVASQTVHHPGSSAFGPPDHLLLDLFWMPVVEPYPISEPFATAGKVNLNYQIAPFTNIKRSTGVRAVMKSVLITALDPFETVTAGGSPPLYKKYKQGLYKTGYNGGTDVAIRHPIDLDATLKFFDDRFSKSRPFISASEICDIPLVPTTANAAGDVNSIENALGSFWKDRVKLTGDNSIEQPYSLIYSRVTSKSNTYQVHVRCQTLNVTSSSTGQTGEFRVTASGEFRGSFLIERYLDPTGDGLVKKDGSGNLVSAVESDSDAFLGPYKVRVLRSKQLAL